MPGILKESKTLENRIATFEVCGDYFGIYLKDIRQVVNFDFDLKPIPLAPHYVLGMFNLRGKAIPVIDIYSFLKKDKNTDREQKGKIAILSCCRILVGVRFDNTGDITTVSKKDIKKIDYSNTDKEMIISSVVKNSANGSLFYLIDTKNILDIDGLPQTEREEQDKKSEVKRVRKQCVGFQVRDTLMGIDIEEVVEITSMQKLERGFIQTPYFLGLLNLRGDYHPVIDFHAFLNNEKARSENHFEGQRSFKILFCSFAGKLVGILVDGLKEIKNYYLDEVQPYLLAEEKSCSPQLYRGVVVQEAKDDLLLINKEMLGEDKLLMSLANGHDQLLNKKEQENHVEEKTSCMTNETFLKFKVHREIGIPIDDVREIINFADGQITEPLGSKKYFTGILNLRGESIPIFDLKKYYNLEKRKVTNEEEKAEEKRLKIIISEVEDQVIGFLIDDISNFVTISVDKKIKVPQLIRQGIERDFQGDISDVLLQEGSTDKQNEILIVYDIKSIYKKMMKSVGKAS